MPLVVAVSTSLAAKNGLLIRDWPAFERARDLNAVVFDQTGTLTEERFGVSDVVLLDGDDEAAALHMAASIESQRSTRSRWASPRMQGQRPLSSLRRKACRASPARAPPCGRNRAMWWRGRRTGACVRSIMMTGDAEGVAKSLSGETGLDEGFAHVLPDREAARLRDLQARGLKVAMVGDGENDAPALVEADLCSAIGAGTVVAAETSHRSDAV